MIDWDKERKRNEGEDDAARMERALREIADLPATASLGDATAIAERALKKEADQGY